MTITVIVSASDDGGGAGDSVLTPPSKKSGRPGSRSSGTSLTFDGERIVIGRGEGCDVRLPDPSVSHRHASLRLMGNAWTLWDEGSTNGTFASGVELLPRTPRTLRTGEKIRVGRVWLVVRMEPAPPTMDLNLATRDVAMALVGAALSKIGGEVTPRLRIVEGHDLDQTLVLTEENHTYIVGRGEPSDLPLLDPDASREHLAVTRRGSTVLIKDLASHNGVLMGEQTLIPQRETAWRSPTLIRVGRTVFALDEPVARALAELEREPDETMTEEEREATRLEFEAEAAHEREKDDAAVAARAQAEAAPTIALGPPPKTSWTATDVMAMIVSVVVLVASAAALFWVLRS